MYYLKDEQGKEIGQAETLDEAILLAWRERGKYYTNPLITFYDEEGEKVGQYPPPPSE